MHTSEHVVAEYLCLYGGMCVYMGIVCAYIGIKQLAQISAQALSTPHLGSLAKPHPPQSANPAWTRSVHLDAPGQQHGQQPVCCPNPNLGQPTLE